MERKSKYCLVKRFSPNPIYHHKRVPWCNKRYAYLHSSSWSPPHFGIIYSSKIVFIPLKLKYFFQTTFKENVNKIDSCVMVLCQFTWNKYLNGIKILKFGILESYKNIKFAVQTFTRNVVIFKSPTLWRRRKEPRSSIDSNQQYMWLSMIAINFRKERRKVEGA